jgi:hypothetical protein
MALCTLAACQTVRDNRSAEIDEPAAAAYIQAQLKRIAPERAIALQLRAGPAWRADMHANGRLELSVAMLLRVADTAELVFLCAHEIGHAELAHFARRDREDWNALSAEHEADAYAERTLHRLRLRADAGRTLLGALIDEASLAPGAESSLHQAHARLDALTARRSAPRQQDADPWPALRTEILQRWLTRDPAHADPERLAILQRARRADSQR